MNDHTELKRLAETANAVTGDVSVEMTLASEPGPNQADIDSVTAFMGSATPAAVLALIAENERLSSACTRAEQVINDESKAAAIATGRANLLQAERDQLRAEVAGLKTGYEAYERVNAELKAENEALRKDAGRYQWLRLADWWRSPICVIRNPKEQAKLGTDCPSGERLDEAVDAALGQGEQS